MRDLPHARAQLHADRPAARPFLPQARPAPVTGRRRARRLHRMPHGQDACMGRRHHREWFPASDRSWQDRSALIAFTAGDRQESTLASLTAFIRRPRDAGDCPRHGTARRGKQRHAFAGRCSAAACRTRMRWCGPRRSAPSRHLPAADRIGLLTPLLSDPVRSVRGRRRRSKSQGPALRPCPRPMTRSSAPALQEYLDSRLANADTPESHMAIGGMALSRRKWDEAEAAFRTATEMDPQLAQAWLVLVADQGGAGRCCGHGGGTFRRGRGLARQHRAPAGARRLRSAPPAHR